jgi:hypothetical protein
MRLPPARLTVLVAFELLQIDIDPGAPVSVTITDLVNGFIQVGH